ncbi:hypothetical protein XELAEV_18033085mg [Xenopus laevis]|uniref:SprT-like domain-containing protein n=1 Tax=Xenopus laevis TaxID=8355 RepID=A0A974HDM0_XENLA|nr:hypothetical protein XELAEV_18033085mg [Xenopus laevis]
MSQENDQTSNSNDQSSKFHHESQHASSPTPTDQPPKSQPSVVDPIWEIIDPKPNLQELFDLFRETIFFGILPELKVKWSRKMTQSAGQCTHPMDENGNCKGCKIELSQPILEQRPRRDTVESLLHEMIHASLCATNLREPDDPHGENFLTIMEFINRKFGTNISIEHSFDKEVEALKKHWWTCNGPCQKVVKRTRNMVPSSKERWFREHEQTCGGNFIKTSEPEVPARKKRHFQKAPESEGPAGKKRKT